MGDDIFHIQGCAQVPAHGLAVVQGHAGLPVDIDPEKPLRALFLELQVPERKPRDARIGSRSCRICSTTSDIVSPK